MTWMKYKYRCLKPRGRYASSSANSAKKTKKLGSVIQKQQQSELERVLIITGTGRKSWGWRETN